MSAWKQNTDRIMENLGGVRVIPVIAVDNPDVAEPLANILVEFGLNVIEVTFRTQKAAEVMAIMAKVPGAIVGAGTVKILKNADLMQTALDAGCKFMVSPGATPALYAAAQQSKFNNIDLIPGTQTSSEVMLAEENGFTRVKFFPFASSGGIDALKNLAPVYPETKFCATGGVTQDNAAKILELPNSFAVGGGWMISKEALKNPAAHRPALEQSIQTAAALNLKIA